MCGVRDKVGNDFKGLIIKLIFTIDV